MFEHEERREKTKAFKVSQKILTTINELIKSSGKPEVEYFEELVNELVIKGLTSEDNEAISPDLRKHFESDVQKLKKCYELHHFYLHFPNGKYLC